ncbi:1-(5-phosphoribosyl)-5-[(5-phosphoribosylamino)methylideneamino]imidazole-4-carboxamide isomerase [Blattabacterium cuenoti]|uniref:1-(5-phosphoribosyl)-5-[(5- phosphoribosylamino)methylideneamino]imidazole-4- carboxamide isomerase n=1 Tax=Blattabacterium cuenoti TaxID=1653831 RepID=UPI00163B6E7D|nr:1-(5-phosphoribosyl)-5-[(5-phosphoribosylamino)methylideneamino]imidazole-4-carboxamide isomerase [Blattabacterium cuenoti]
MEIIAAIDIIDGQCVRLIQGNYQKKTIYKKNPLDMAIFIEQSGLSRLHLVDLDGAKQRKIINWKILNQIARYTNLTIDFGGGIYTEEDIKIVFDNGADIATIGSMAVTNSCSFNNIIHIYGANKILLGVDVKNNKIATDGWTKLHNISLFKFLEEKVKQGINKIFCTDISKDGLLSGPSFLLYKTIIKQFPNIKVIASGGIESITNIHKLHDLGCHGVIIGKAIYENKILISDLKTLSEKYYVS